MRKLEALYITTLPLEETMDTITLDCEQSIFFLQLLATHVREFRALSCEAARHEKPVLCLQSCLCGFWHILFCGLRKKRDCL